MDVYGKIMLRTNAYHFWQNLAFVNHAQHMLAAGPLLDVAFGGTTTSGANQHCAVASEPSWKRLTGMPPEFA